jgi:hypothetical protein
MILLSLLREWLFSEKGVTLATCLLVLATLILAFDSWRGRREQRKRWAKEDVDRRREHDELQERWRREDAIRESENTPKPEFGLRKSDSDHELILWCANLGTVSFLLTEIRIKGVLRTTGQDTLDVLRISPVIVARGAIDEVNLSKISRVARGFFEQQWSVSLLLTGPHGELVTEGKLYNIHVTNNQVVRVDPGLHGPMRLLCPKCNGAPVEFKLDGLASEEEFHREFAHVSDDLNESCPDHKSSSTRVSMLPPAPEGVPYPSYE